MASVITVAFENWKAQEAASGKAVLLDEFVFANVPNLDPAKPIDRNEKLPPANQIVHRQAVNKAGLASENAVAYSVTLGAEVGNFDFNWIGLLNKASGTVAMITQAPIQKKLKTQNGQQGNVLTRSFILEFQGAAEETQIKTSAETWQIDFTARLSGIDEMQRLINVDSYGAAAFFNDGFEVTRSGEQYTVKKGLGYVGGLRGELAQNQILNGLRNTKVYADFSYQGNIVSQWNTVIKITAAATLNNYVDSAGFTHQVFAIASIDANGNVKDLRPMGALSSQEISALETRFRLDLSKKIDKANISGQKGNDNDKVPSLNLFTIEIGKLATFGYSYSKIESDGKYQAKGNYAPAGNYADGNLFRVGQGGAESWVYTPNKSKVFNVNNSGLSGVYDWSTNRYLWGFDSNGMMSSGLIPVAFGGTGARNA
ncbi:phage tail protein, partial [Providencia rettgeri]